MDDRQVMGGLALDHPMGQELARPAAGSDPDRESGGEPQTLMTLYWSKQRQPSGA